MRQTRSSGATRSRKTGRKRKSTPARRSPTPTRRSPSPRLSERETLQVTRVRARLHEYRRQMQKHKPKFWEHVKEATDRDLQSRNFKRHEINRAVVIGLGSMHSDLTRIANDEVNWSISIWQLALTLQLLTVFKNNFKPPVVKKSIKIYAYDPAFDDVDIRALREEGIEVERGGEVDVTDDSILFNMYTPWPPFFKDIIPGKSPHIYVGPDYREAMTGTRKKQLEKMWKERGGTGEICEVRKQFMNNRTWIAMDFHVVFKPTGITQTIDTHDVYYKL